MTTDEFRSGFATILGRPNVGKSTLLNRLVGQKISITSRRPQTTRHRILGIHTDNSTQLAVVDTPGLHPGQGKAMNRIINRAARNSLIDVDAVILMITASGWTHQDRDPLMLAMNSGLPTILAINKIDHLKQKSKLLPLIDESQRKGEFGAIVPISAMSGKNLDRLVEAVRPFLPAREKHFPGDDVTDRNLRFISAELIREQLFRQLGQELPYVTAVQIEKFSESPSMTRIEADIWVERRSQKGIVLGKEGTRIKSIGIRSRQEIERLLGSKVDLQLHVKVRERWSDDDKALRTLGYSTD